MFPELDLGFVAIDMYTVMIIIGLFLAMLMFRYLTKINKVPENTCK